MRGCPATSVPSLVEWTLAEAQLDERRLHRSGKDSDPLIVVTPRTAVRVGLSARQEDRRAMRLPEGHRSSVRSGRRRPTDPRETERPVGLGAAAFTDVGLGRHPRALLHVIQQGARGLVSTPANIGVTPGPVSAAAAKFKTDSAAGAAKTGLDDVRAAAQAHAGWASAAASNACANQWRNHLHDLGRRVEAAADGITQAMNTYMDTDVSVGTELHQQAGWLEDF